VSERLPTALTERIAVRLEEHLAKRPPGHCVRVDDLTADDARALAEQIVGHSPAFDTNVLAQDVSWPPLEIKAERAIELRNRKVRPLLLLVPAGAGHAASSLDNSFEPLPLIEELREVAAELEREVAATEIGRLVADVKRALGRTRQVETWARFLGKLADSPTPEALGRNLWQVGLIPDHGDDDLGARLRRNVSVIAAISRPSRPTARVIERLRAAGVKDGQFSRELQAFLEQQDAGVLADTVRWTREIGVEHQNLTFENWVLAETQNAGLRQVKVMPFRKEDGTVDSRSKLHLDENDGQLYCEVTEDKPGAITVRWMTEPAKTTSVASWRVEVLPPPDLREIDTAPLVATKVKGDKRQATLRVEASADDLTASALFVVRVRGLDVDAVELSLEDGLEAAAESDQFEIRLQDELPPPPARSASAPSLPWAVLETAINAGGDLTESAPIWDPAGQVFDVRIGRRRALIRVSRVLAGLQRRLNDKPSRALAFSAHSPLGEPIDADKVEERQVVIPPALAEWRQRLLTAIASHAPRDLVEVLGWDDDLRAQARGYVQRYRRALDNADDTTRVALLAMDTLIVAVGAATEKVSGLVLLPTHPLRLAWVSAHDQLLRIWAEKVAVAGKTKAERVRHIDIDMVSRLSPANLPFITIGAEGGAFLYAEELTYGAALYLPVTTLEPQSAADIICSAIDVARDNADLMASADALSDRIRSYRNAHPGTGTLRIMALNPGSGAVVRRALAPLALSQIGDDDQELPEPQRIEVIAYSNRLSYTNPVADLRQLQRMVSAEELQRAASHLVPPFGLAARDIARMTRDAEGHHLAVLQDLARVEIADLPGEPVLRSTAFGDLLTPLSSEAAADERGAWYVTPTLKPRTKDRVEADIVEAHRAHQAAVALSLGLAKTVPALAIRLGNEDLKRVEAAHDRADWVITLDQGIGPEFFEETSQQTPGDKRYLLDYAPDFLEGLGRKLAVTTKYHGEVRRILSKAMLGLGIAQDEASVSQVLNGLLLVSGRLALRLLRDNSLSSEAVSLAALMTHLKTRGQLEDRIVVPIDAHPEIFGTRVGQGDEPARRCDMLLVRVTQRRLRIECVEVKGRRPAQLPDALADDIVDQLEQTERVLLRQFFPSEQPRVDGALRRAYLAGLLHYYADRSARGGLIDLKRLPELHHNIDRIEETAEQPEIEKTGYVISVAGDSGFRGRRGGIPIKVLTADDLGKAGFTSIIEPIDPPLPGGPSSPPAAPIPARPATAQPMTQVRDETTAYVVPRHEPDADQSAATSRDEEASPRDEAEYDGAAPSEVIVELGADAGGSPVTWTVATKGSPHAFILGIPGQGKSVTTRRIIREFARQGLASLILDFHGDMAADPPPGAQVIDATDGLKLNPFELPSQDQRKVNETAWEVAEIIGYVCDLGDIQRNVVYEALQQTYSTARGVPTMAQFTAAVEEAERDAKVKNARARIRPLTDFGLFADDAADTFDAVWRGGMVIDLSNLSLETVQLAAAAFVLRKIYREMFRWPQEGTLRLAVILDEAHRLAKDVTLPKLMKEGRKYGIPVVVASQGSSDFHQQVLGNAGTKIIFRTNFPESRSVAGFIRGREGTDLSQQIEQLAVGSAYVATPDHIQARKVYMHE
jgi:DNA phosphorothioation-dependent restriction protein DptH